jgi:putative oxidoreductase
MYKHQCKSIALFILRLSVAVIFLYAGLMKFAFFDPANVAPEMAGTGMLTLLKVLAVAEPLAAASLILGLLTPASVIGCIVVMIGALWMKAGGQPFAVWQIDMLLLAVLVAILFLGPGRYSLDALLCKKCGCGKCMLCKCCGGGGCGCGGNCEACKKDGQGMK